MAKHDKLFNILTIIALLSIVSLSAVVIPASIKNSSVPESSAFTGFFYVNSQSSKLFLEQDRGSDFLKVEFWTQFYKSVDANWNPAKYVGLNQITLGTTDCYWLNGTSYDSDFYVKFDSNAVLIYEYQQFTKFEGWTRFVPINNTMTISPFFAFDGNDCYLTDDDEAYSGDIFYGVDYEGLVSGDYYDNFFTELTYKLNPIISINSSHFNADNTRIKIYDQYRAEWIEQTIDQISLSHPLYKIRIYSKEDNTLLYEDSEFQQFSVYREIDISSIRYVNNAPEPVNIDLYYNQSVDWGTSENDIFSSFDYKMSDADQVTPKTGVLQWGTVENPDLSSIVDLSAGGGSLSVVDLMNHKNILNLTDTDSTASAGFRINFSSFESTGFIEFYNQRPTVSGVVFCRFYDQVGNQAIDIYLTHATGQGFYDYTTTTWNWIANPTSNTWFHYKITYDCTAHTYTVHKDGVLVASYTMLDTATDIRNMRTFTWSTGIGNAYFDAVACSQDGYIAGYNQRIAGWYDYDYANTALSINDTLGYERVLQLYDNSAVAGAQGVYYTPTLPTSGIIEYYWATSTLSSGAPTYFDFRQSSSNRILVVFYSGYIQTYNGSWHQVVAISVNTWYHMKIEFNLSQYNLTINGINYGTYLTQGSPAFYSYLRINTENGGSNYYAYFRSLRFSWDDPIYKYPVKTTQVNPYAMKYEFHEPLNYLVQVSDLYNNVLLNGSLSASATEFIYTPPSMQPITITLRDSQANYLNWENYKLYRNGTLINDRLFYGEKNTFWNITAVNAWGDEISHVFQVATENYWNLTIPVFDYSIYNQQENFCRIDIVREGYNLSKWLAPSESIGYNLPAGDWDVNILSLEKAITFNYEITLAGTDYLLITSDNTLYNALSAISNTNSSIGNQITNVSITLTNIDSNVSNQFTNIEIILENQNSTLTNVLISQSALLEVIQSNLTLVINQMLTFEAMESTIALIAEQWLYLQAMNSNITEADLLQVIALEMLNSTIISLFNEQSINLSVIGSNITDLMLQQNLLMDVAANLTNIAIETNLGVNLLNSSIFYLYYETNSSLTLVQSSITQLGSDMSSNYLILNSQIASLGVDMSANFTLLGSEINQTIFNLSQDLYLINGSIYSVVANLSQSFSVSNSSILGNVSILLERDYFLNDVYWNCYFRDAVNWEGAANNQTVLDQRVSAIDISNEYRNTSVVITLGYLNHSDQVELLPNTPYTLIFPVGTTYLGSDGTNGTILPTTKSISFGYYEEDYSDIYISGVNSTDFIFSLGIIVGTAFLVYRQYSKISGLKIFEEKKKKRITNNPIDTFRGGR